MGQVDWDYLTGGLGDGDVKRGVTTGITRAAGGGSFCYGFNSVSGTDGVVARRVDLASYAPLASGGSVRAAVRRLSSSPTPVVGFSPFLFLCCSSGAVTGMAYLLGLANADPYHLVLRKGVVEDGVPDEVPNAPTNQTLRRSTGVFAPDQWHHLRLDAAVQPGGDVILRVFQNDLGHRPLGTTPNWVAIPGMGDFVDDALTINTGSAPLLSGRAGFAFRTTVVGRRAAFDHFEVIRQT